MTVTFILPCRRSPFLGENMLKSEISRAYVSINSPIFYHCSVHSGSWRTGASPSCHGAKMRYTLGMLPLYCSADIKKQTSTIQFLPTDSIVLPVIQLSCMSLDTNMQRESELRCVSLRGDVRHSQCVTMQPWIHSPGLDHL